MKRFIGFWFFMFSVLHLFAECASQGMQFFPRQHEISLQPVLMIQGYGMSQEKVAQLHCREVFLESENGDLVPLKLQRILWGQMELVQAIFMASETLETNTLYYLKFAEQTEEETRELMRYNRSKREHERVFWRTTNKRSWELLSLDLHIAFKKTEVNWYGCGPSAHAIFDVENRGESEVWYKTELVDMETNTKTVYYISDREGQVYVGHGMCSGAFGFRLKGQYKVQFTPMNLDGKHGKPTAWYVFESPFSRSEKMRG